MQYKTVKYVSKMVKNVQNALVLTENQIKIKQNVFVKILNTKIKINCVNFATYIKIVSNVQTQCTVKNVIRQKDG